MPSKKNQKTISKKIKAQRITNRRMVPLYFVFGAVLALGGLFFFVYRENKVKILEGLEIDNNEKIALEQKIRQMVRGYPIEEMIPYIVEKDSVVAAFLVSIAKKESNWGKRSPKYQGKDCYNYWGYRGPNRVGSGRHSCFANPKEAVDTVGERIAFLAQEKKLDTPKKMIVWKCGSTCAGHSAFSVSKWISDVDLYFGKLTTSLWKR